MELSKDVYKTEIFTVHFELKYHIWQIMFTCRRKKSPNCRDFNWFSFKMFEKLVTIFQKKKKKNFLMKNPVSL